MESSSNMSGVSLPENFYRGQKQVAEAVARATDAVTAKLPTGYGKTRVFCAAFAIKRAQGVADYLLYLVPRDVQVHQAAEEVPRILRDDFGIETKSVIVRDDPKVAIKSIKKGDALVFVSTIQGLATSAALRDTLNEILRFGKWFRAIDEYHNLPKYVLVRNQKIPGRYFEELAKLPCTFELRMTATPRLDSDNDPFPPPSPVVRYREARKENVVKKLCLNSYEYRVDGIMVDGEVRTFTTNDFQDADSIEEMVLAGKMRWSPKYISPLIMIPVDRMLDYRVRGIRTQMIVKAATCSHAELVCRQIRTLLPDMEVDWVGTGPNGRNEKENRDVLNRFCPPKASDGKRHWTLDILVQRGMAGEGLDTTDVSEVVILAGCSGTVSDMQLFGRGARVIRGYDGKVLDVVCTINVDSATEIVKDDRYLGTKIMDIFDSDDPYAPPDDDKEEPEEPAQPSEYREMPDKPTVILADVSLVDVRTEPGYEDAFQAMKNAPGTSHKTDDELRDIADAAIRDFIRKRDESLNMSSVIAQLKTQVDAAVSKVVGLLMKKVGDSGLRVEGSRAGDLKRLINSKKKKLFGAVDAGEETLRNQYAWLKEIERSVLMGEIPEWLK